MTDKYDDALGTQLAMNSQTWAQLTEHGVDPDTELRLGFLYWCPGKAAAEALSQELTSLGYAVECERRGSLLRRVWAVEGETPPSTWSLEKLNVWVTEMVGRARAHQSEFDGWGASVPG